MYQKLNEWLGRSQGESGDRPVMRGEEWFAKNRRSQIREITDRSQSTTVGKYWEAAHDSGVVLTFAKTRGNAWKSAGDLAIKWYKTDEWSLYDLIKGGIAAEHESGEVYTSRILLRWATEDEDGPMIPRASVRFFRTFLAWMWFGYTKRRKRIFSERRNPYVGRRRTAYCWMLS